MKNEFEHGVEGEVVRQEDIKRTDEPTVIMTAAQDQRIRECQALFKEALGRGFAQRQQMHPDPDHPDRRSDEALITIAIQTLKMNGYTHAECVQALMEVQVQPTNRAQRRGH